MDAIRLTDRDRGKSLLVGVTLVSVALILCLVAVLSGVAIKTGSIYPGDPGACYTSGTAGDLVTDPVAGVAIIEGSGRRMAVTWPPGWTARRTWIGVEVLDSHGDVHMRTGTSVYLMGGYWSDGSFITCGGRTL